MKSTKLRSWTDKVFGLQPLPAPPHVFALEEGQLTYARFEVDGSATPALLERISVEIAAGAFEASSLGVAISDDQKLAEALNRLLSQVAAPVNQASLVVPDGWLRMTFLDSEELPVAADARHEVLQWKLGRILPFRVEELRLDAQEVEALPVQSEPVRTLVGFATEALLEGLEALFADAKVEVGCITNRSSGLLLTLAEALEPAALGALVLVEDRHFTLIATRFGVPVLFRHKALEDEGGLHRESGILRDLRLTRGFLVDRQVGDAFEAVELVSVPAQRSQWQEWLARSLGREARFHDFDAVTTDSSRSATMGAMAGVVKQEIR